jgi:hypothetical protein
MSNIKKDKEIRQLAHSELQKRIERGYNDEQQALFTAGMFVMWRLCNKDKGPLWTLGPDNFPKEI